MEPIKGACRDCTTPGSTSWCCCCGEADGSKRGDLRLGAQLKSRGDCGRSAGCLAATRQRKGVWGKNCCSATVNNHRGEPEGKIGGTSCGNQWRSGRGDCAGGTATA